MGSHEIVGYGSLFEILAPTTVGSRPHSPLTLPNLLRSYSDFLVAYTLMLGFRGVYCGWFSDFVRRTCGGVNALVALTHVLWAAQLGCWIIPQTPKLWNYEEEMAKEVAMDAEAQSAKQA